MFHGQSSSCRFESYAMSKMEREREKKEPFQKKALEQRTTQRSLKETTIYSMQVD